MNIFQMFAKYYLRSKTKKTLDAHLFNKQVQPLNLLKYKEILMQAHPGCTYKRIAQEQYKNRKFPIHQIDIVPQKPVHKLLIFGGVHGDESAGVYAVPEIMRMLKQHKQTNWHIRIITPINPSGVHLHTRYNQDGYDINRDFRYFETQGARIKKAAVDEFAPDLVVSLHEGPQRDYVFISTKKVPRHIIKHIKKTLKEHKQFIRTRLALGFLHIRNGELLEGRFIKNLKRVLRIKTLGSYCDERKIGLITTESSWSDPVLENRIKPHVLTIQAIIES